MLQDGIGLDGTAFGQPASNVATFTSSILYLVSRIALVSFRFLFPGFLARSTGLRVASSFNRVHHCSLLSPQLLQVFNFMPPAAATAAAAAAADVSASKVNKCQGGIGLAKNWNFFDFICLRLRWKF